MASDEIVWDIINNQFCGFKIKTSNNQTFCRNEYNNSGYCSKQHCPLANSRYATVRSDPASGRLYLFMKTAERVHTPNKWWERVRLPSDYDQALQTIDERLIYWPKFLIHKCKQRLTRLTQVAMRARRLQKEDERLGEALVPRLAAKVRRRESTRERKAGAAAKVDRAVERELIDRLRSGAYGDRPLNVEEAVWKRVLDALEHEDEAYQEDGQQEEEEEISEEQEWEKENEAELEDGVAAFDSDVEFVSDDDDFDYRGGGFETSGRWLGDTVDSDESAGDVAEGEEGDSSTESGDGVGGDPGRGAALLALQRKRKATDPVKRSKKSSKGPRREIEYEFEPAEAPRPQMVDA